jgi:tetratricopeptide (TPR) repeat protein
MKYDNAGGIADYDKALEYDPNDAYSWNNRGLAKKDSGDKAGAIADFKKALEINPRLPTTRQLLKELGATP